MRTQKITVNTKGGLLAAFECARNYPYGTEVNLIRKSGTTKSILKPMKADRYRWDFNSFDKAINKAKKKIRRISAAELLS